MAYNKVVLKGQTLLDLTADTVAPDTLAKGVTAHDKTGAQITGTMESGGGASTKYGATVNTFLGDVVSTGKLSAPTVQTDLVFDGVTDIGDKALYFFNYQCPRKIKSVSFPHLTTVTGIRALQWSFYNTAEQATLENISFPQLVSVVGDYAFSNAFQASLGTAVLFPVLDHVDGTNAFSRAFDSCRNLQSARFPALVSIKGSSAFSYAFSYCYAMTEVSFPKLTQIGRDDVTNRNNNSHFASAFDKLMTEVTFPALEKIYCTGGSVAPYGTFYNNSYIQKLYFPKLTTIDKNPNFTGSGTSTSHTLIFSNCNALTEIHFGAANQAAIEASEGYPTLWGRGAGNATVYFDL